jgi:hypothetical protein
MQIDKEIIAELYKTLELLGADHGLLGTVGSWKDCLPDEDVLANLKGWNEATAKEKELPINNEPVPEPTPARTVEQMIDRVNTFLFGSPEKAAAIFKKLEQKKRRAEKRKFPFLRA